MTTVVLLLLGLEAGGQGQELDPLSRIDATVKELCPNSGETERKALVIRIATTIQFDRFSKEDQQAICKKLEYLLSDSLQEVRTNEKSVQSLTQSLGSSYSAALPPTPEFRSQAESLALMRVDAFAEEQLNPPPITSIEKETIIKQSKVIEEVLVTEGKRFVRGQYADKIIDENVVRSMEEWRSLFGNRLAGGISRPLSESELGNILEQIRQRARSFPMIDAKEAPDSPTKAGQNEHGLGTADAISALGTLQAELSVWYRICYPKCAQLHEDSQRLATALFEWRKITLGNLKSRLDSDRAHQDAAITETLASLESKTVANVRQRETELQTKDLGSVSKPAIAGKSEDGSAKDSSRWGLVAIILVIAAIIPLGVILKKRN